MILAALNIAKVAKGILGKKNILNNAILKRTKIKRENFIRNKNLRKKKIEYQQKREKENKLEAISTFGKRGFGKFMSGPSNIFKKIIDFVGVVLVGWVVNNLPQIIEAIKNFIKRVETFIESLQSFFDNVKKWFGGMANVITETLNNWKNFDFTDKSGKVKAAVNEMNSAFDAMVKDFDNMQKSITGEINELEGTSGGGGGYGGDIDASNIKADTPEEKAFIATVRELEGTSGDQGYNTWFGGRTDMDLSKMTVNEVVAEQERRLAAGEATYNGLRSAAVGAGQFLHPEQTVQAMGLDPSVEKYTAELQNKMILFQSLKYRGVDPSKKLTGRDMTILGKEWASFTPHYGQTNRTASQSLSVYQKNLKEAGDGNKKRNKNQNSAYQMAVNVGRSLEAAGYRAWQHPDFNVNKGYTGSGKERVMMRGYNSYHNYGEALDYPLSHNTKEQLDKLYKYFNQNRRHFGVAELLWQTKDHYDHLHVSFKGGGISPVSRNNPSLRGPNKRRQIVIIEEDSPPNIATSPQSNGKSIIVSDMSLNRFMKQHILLDLAYT